MEAIELIAKHLPLLNDSGLTKCETICAVTGKQITEGFLTKNFITKTFTNYEIFRYNSKHISKEVAICLSDCIPTPSGTHSPLRYYSYLVTVDSFETLQRENILQILKNPPTPPFILAITFGRKKHTAIFAKTQSNKENYQVITDKGLVNISLDKVNKYLPTMQKWYSQPENIKETFFNKSEIEAGCNNYTKIDKYGSDQYFTENELLNQFRESMDFEVLLYALNKTIAPAVQIIEPVIKQEIIKKVPNQLSIF